MGRYQIINFLDIKIILHEDGTIETEIYYKPTNNHHYLEYDSFHPQHIKDNIPYGLAKKINIFTTDPNKVQKLLKEMKNRFLELKYPENIIDRAIHNAFLQGPAPKPETKKDVIPLVTTYSDYSQQNVVQQANILIERCPDDSTRRSFDNKRIIQAFRQPPNLQRHLTSARFSDEKSAKKENGIFTCGRKHCKLCKYYLVPCKTFKVERGVEWEVKSHIDCNSKNVIYFQRCNFCTKVSNIGKTNILRKRMNVHISSCRHGTGSDIFDQHVHQCNNGRQPEGPYFKLWVMMQLADATQLLTYENYFHRKGYDTLNYGKPE